MYVCGRTLRDCVVMSSAEVDNSGGKIDLWTHRTNADVGGIEHHHKGTDTVKSCIRTSLSIMLIHGDSFNPQPPNCRKVDTLIACTYTWSKTISCIHTLIRDTTIMDCDDRPATWPHVQLCWLGWKRTSPPVRDVLLFYHIHHTCQKKLRPLLVL